MNNSVLEEVWVPDAAPEQCNEIGNEFFRKNEFLSALGAYHKALSVNSTARTNRCATYLKLRKWAKAEADARQVMRGGDKGKKGAFRLAQALLHQDRVDEALEAVKGIKHPAVREFREHCKRWRKEKKGKFNIRKMWTEPHTGVRLDSPHAEYTHPAVGIRPHSIYGRELVATADIPQHTLILASRALFACEKSGNDALATLTMQMCDPEDRRQILSLSGGRAHPGLKDDEPLPPVDVMRMVGVLSTNAFELRLKPVPATKHLGMMGEKTGTGLWIKPSLLNHSCAPNCTWGTVVDHMFVYTTRAVPKGDSLTVAYTNDNEFNAVKARFSDWATIDGFDCQCPRCVFYRANSDLIAADATIRALFNTAAVRVGGNGESMSVAAKDALYDTRMQQAVRIFKRCQPPDCCKTAVCLYNILLTAHEMGLSRSPTDAHFNAGMKYARTTERLLEATGFDAHSFDRRKILFRIAGLAAVQDESLSNELMTGSIEAAWPYYCLNPDADAFVNDLMTYALPGVDEACRAHGTIGRFNGIKGQLEIAFAGVLGNIGWALNPSTGKVEPSDDFELESGKSPDIWINSS